jgi:hypothetical protein
MGVMGAVDAITTLERLRAIALKTGRLIVTFQIYWTRFLDAIAQPSYNPLAKAVSSMIKKILQLL